MVTRMLDSPAWSIAGAGLGAPSESSLMRFQRRGNGHVVADIDDHGRLTSSAIREWISGFRTPASSTDDNRHTGEPDDDKSA